MTTTAERARIRNGRLHIDLDGIGVRELHPIWLRERSPSPEVHDPKTGQRLLDSWSLPLDLAVTDVAEDGERLDITFSDGHVAPFTLEGLARQLRRPRDERDDIVLWDGGLQHIPEADWARARGDDAALHEMLEQLRKYAFVVVRNVPVELDGVAEVVEHIGPMRRTNWGGIADVKAIADAYDLSMTTRALEPHTDNPYREPVPGYIFLHCLVNNAEGGDSMITDGFRVAESLCSEAPEAFDALTRVRPRFTYVDDDTVLENSGPLIELDEEGRVRQVRLSNRTDSIDAEDAELLERYYRARNELTRRVNDPAYQLHFKLGPGDLLIMDNYRLYHGRAGYRPGTGDRHMRQCYMDRDTVGSRRKVLARRHG